MPRNKGYTPMRADARGLTDSPINGTSCCVTASVRYAKIDSTTRPRPPRTARPPKPDPPPRYTSPPSSSSTLSGATTSKESSAPSTTCPSEVTKPPPNFGLNNSIPAKIPNPLQPIEILDNFSDINPLSQETPLVMKYEVSAINMIKPSFLGVILFAFLKLQYMIKEKVDCPKTVLLKSPNSGF